MANSWTISAAGKVYGPFSREQMQAFVKEGRLASHSLVARNGSKEFAEACADGELAPLFSAEMPSAPVPAATVQPSRREEPAPARHAARDAKQQPERARFLIVADMKSGSISALEEEIFNLGPAYSVAPQAWIASTTLSINAVRNLLVQKLGKLDVLFVADTTHDKAAWFNFGPEAEARIRRIWAPLTEAVAR